MSEEQETNLVGAHQTDEPAIIELANFLKAAIIRYCEEEDLNPFHAYAALRSVQVSMEGAFEEQGVFIKEVEVAQQGTIH